MVPKPGSSPTVRIPASRARPVRMPGSAIGNTNSSVIDSLPLNVRRASANAASVPRTSASSVAAEATTSESRIDSQMSVRAKATSNQCSVNPGGGNWYVRSSVVKAYNAITQTGACRNTRPTAAITFVNGEGRSQEGLRGASERIERSEPLGQHQVQADQHDRHHGERGSERQVSGRALLLVHHHADEVAGCADHARDDVVAEREREREDRARGQPWQSERQHDVAERLPGLRA